MQLVKSLKAVTLASMLAAAGAAQADSAQTFDSDPISVKASSSFVNEWLADITLNSTSNVTGNLWFLADGTTSKGKHITFSSVTFSGSSLSGNSIVLPATSDTFSFTNLAAGTYHLMASGDVGSGKGGWIGATYTVTPVPEPESYAMFLAGLGIMGAIARRRKNWA